jgi:hypothetical protein
MEMDPMRWQNAEVAAARAAAACLIEAGIEAQVTSIFTEHTPNLMFSSKAQQAGGFLLDACHSVLLY